MDTKMRKYSFNDILVNLFTADKSYLSDYIGTIKNNNLDQKLLTKGEADALDAFEKLYRELGNVPTIDLFRNSYPNYEFESDLKANDLLGIIRVFIKQRKNIAASNLLMDEARKVSIDGLTPEITENISNILKSDAVDINYENITNKIVNMYERKLDNTGIKTGIGPIDDMVGGLKAGQVSVVAGFTGHGKSITSVSIMHSAIEQGFNVCYLSLELSAEHLMYNLISRHSLGRDFARKIEHRDLKSKKLSEDDWNYVKDRIIPDLNSLPGKFYIMDEQDIEAYNFFAFDNKFQEIENLAIQETGKGLDLIIVDHVQMLAYTGQDAKLSENTIVNRWCNYFRSNCLDFLKSKRQLHVILVAQINRLGFKKAQKNNGMYDLTALKEANEIETCASVILGVFSDPSLIVSNQIKVGILKNRDGSRFSEPYICSADFAYQLVGGDGPTTSSTMLKADLNVLLDVNDYTSAITEEFSTWLDNYEPITFEVPNE